MEEELDPKFKAKYERFVGLADEYKSDQKMHELMDELTKRAYKQLEVVMSFFVLGGNAETDVRASELAAKAGANSTVLKALVNKGVFKTYEKRVSRLKSFSALTDAGSIQFTDKQQQAFEEKQRQYSVEFDNEGAANSEKISEIVDDYIKKYNQTHGYDMIISKASLLFANEALNITAEVLDGLNSEYKSDNK